MARPRRRQTRRSPILPANMSSLSVTGRSRLSRSVWSLFPDLTDGLMRSSDSYYEKKADERPPLFRIEEQKDGRVLVRLYEDLGDHIATWALYKSDRTGKGYDVAFDPNEKKVIDFMN